MLLASAASLWDHVLAYKACCTCNCGAVQDDQTSQQLATQACGFITIVSGTFLLHATKDLDLSQVHLEHMLDRKEAAAMASSAALSQGSVVQRRPQGAASMELGALDSAKVDSAENGIVNGTPVGKESDGEHMPLIGTGPAQVGGSGMSTLGSRKQRGFGSLFG
jgi:hypothetical protein